MLDAIGKPIDVIITHAHRYHYGNIANLADTNVYAETSNAAALLADPGFTSIYSANVIAVSGYVQLAGLELTSENISNTDATENAYVLIPDDKSLFLGDLVFNRSHAFIATSVHDCFPNRGVDRGIHIA